MSKKLPLEPGKYLINALILSGTNKTIDVRNLFSEINIYEDLFTSTYYGTLLLTDANNLISGTDPIPLVGNENLLINFTIPNVRLTNPPTSGSVFEPRNLILLARVVDVENRTLLNERSQQYIIHFVQEELLTDKKNRISKSYRNQKYRDMIESIINEISPGNNQYDLEDTAYLYNVIVPYWNPIKAINWMTQRSLSPRYKSSAYLFYTNIYNKLYNSPSKPSNWFFLKHLETMLGGQVQRTVFFQPANIFSGSSKSIYDPRVYSNITTYEVLESFKMLDLIPNGFYANNILTHDLKNKTYSKQTFNYERAFPSFVHADAGKLLGKVPDMFGKKATDYPDSEWRFYSKDEALECNNHIESVTPSKLSQMLSLHNFRIRFVLPGDGRTSPGDIIEFSIPSPEKLTRQNKNPQDKYYSGKYLVTSMRHIFQPEKYDVIYECSKESLAVEP